MVGDLYINSISRQKKKPRRFLSSSFSFRRPNAKQLEEDDDDAGGRGRSSGAREVEGIQGEPPGFRPRALAYCRVLALHLPHHRPVPEKWRTQISLWQGAAIMFVAIEMHVKEIRPVRAQD